MTVKLPRGHEPARTLPLPSSGGSNGPHTPLLVGARGRRHQGRDDGGAVALPAAGMDSARTTLEDPQARSPHGLGGAAPAVPEAKADPPLPAVVTAPTVGAVGLVARPTESAPVSQLRATANPFTPAAELACATPSMPPTVARPRPVLMPPTFLGFRNFKAVRDVVAMVNADGNLDLGGIRRHQSSLGVDGKPEDPRPWSDDVAAMYDPDFMGHGATPLPPEECALSQPAFDRGHRGHCTMCASHADGVDPACPWSIMRLQLTHGVKVPFIPGSTGVPEQKYATVGAEGNHGSATAYGAFASRKVAAMLAGGVVRKCSGPEPPGSPARVVSPQGVAISGSKRRQLKQLTGIDPRCDASLEAAVKAQRALHPELPVPKPRLIIDMSASGLNGELLHRGFRQKGMSGALEIMTKDCHFGLVDVEAFYHQWSVDEEQRPLYSFMQEREIYEYLRMAFGCRSAPRILLMWTAQIIAILRAKGMVVTATTDDFVFAKKTAAERDADMALIVAVLEELGFKLSEGKCQTGQQVDYVGFRFDSVKMTVSFMPDRANWFRLCLQDFAAILRSGGDIPRGTWSHVCGKLEDLAMLLQAGKVRVSEAWLYLQYGPALSAVCRGRMLENLEWWDAQLEMMARGDPTGSEYPVINGSVLEADPTLVHVLVSDMSGDDGVGSYSGSLDEADPAFYTETWGPGNPKPPHSFAGELTAVQRHLRRQAIALQQRDGPRPPASVLICVMDSLSAVQSFNAGRCKDPLGNELLRMSYDDAALLNVTLIGVWHYRELNALADELSHLARILGRDSVQGRLSDLEWTRASAGPCSGAGGGEAGGQGGDLALRQVPGALHGAPVRDGLHGRGHVLGGVHGGQPREHGVADERAQLPAHAARAAVPALPHGPGGGAAQARRQGLETPGPATAEPQGPAALRDREAHRGGDGPSTGASAAAGDPPAARHAGPDADQGDHGRPARLGRHLAPQQPHGDHHRAGADQDVRGRLRRADHSVGHDGADLRLQVPGAPLRGAAPGPAAVGLRLLPDPQEHAVAQGQGIGQLGTPADQALGGGAGVGPNPLLRPLDAGRRRHRHVRRGPPVLRHQEVREVGVRRGPRLLPERGVDRGVGGVGVRHGDVADRP